MNPASDGSARDRQLEAILHAYLQAVDAGRPPDREAVLQQHPEFASELEAFFGNQDVVSQLARGMTESVVPALRGVEVSTPTLGEPSAPAPGTQVRYFGDYELLEEIARGGMGVVYKARQVSLNRSVALKMILTGQFASAADVQRFQSEAEAAANLDHPHIVPIYEIGEHEGQHYFSMKLVDGGSLADALRTKPQPLGFGLDYRSPTFAVRTIATVARAVHYAHQRGILHRDLKPGNILLERRARDANSPVPFVTDFGLAKRVGGDSKLTRSGAIVGTPSYMAPEQARGDKGLSVAADVYSLGAILYELLTGRPPFQAATPLDTVVQLLEQEPVSPRRYQPRLDRDLETVCLKCLEKVPERRYGSAEALADDLERWQRGDAVGIRPTTTLERWRRWCVRNPTLAALIASIVLLALAGTGGITFFAVHAHFQRSEALANASRADDEKNRANQEAADAVAKERLARRYRYIAEIQLAHAAWRESEFGEMWRLLERHIPKEGDTDLRGLEWYHLWRLCRGNVFFHHHGAVSCLAFSPDGRLLVTGGADRTVRVWNSTTGKELITLRGHGARINSVAFSPDGKQIASGDGAGAFTVRDEPGEVRIWDASSGQVLRALNSGIRAVTCIAFSPDGKRIVTCGRQVVAWDLATGQKTVLRP
ncbi:MAG TPA: serine/threonine-protein kinase [Gemmataceae bacterium]|nr:serine/threonine-protein kinase [Gemmataceae bacterium]